MQGSANLGASQQSESVHFGTLFVLPLDTLERPQGFLYSVYILIAFALREYRVIDRTADVKGKLQLTVF
jgi:hypothetical protein